ncbi:MAG: putative DNA binding domain-containing protein [Ureaplasma sp.]|nr:putative DNA binding domain-containing protein [Ureaplasma sp.]MDE7221775.1 putative DNA binding domain-containing protein [Ureaplasma sp.]
MINFGIETEELEFKKTTGELHDAMNDIVAILNKHEKGTLYFGIAPNGDAKGQQITESSLRDVSRFIYESIKPQIYPQIQKITIDGCDIIEVKFEGQDRPYAAYGKYYIRVADESRELTPSELKKMMLISQYSKHWEYIETDYTIADVDEESLKHFYERAIACGRLSKDGYDKEKLLNKLGLLKNGKLNNAGNYLFGKNGPIILKMAIFATDEKLTFLDINRTEDNIFKLVDLALTYITKNIRWRVEIGNRVREEIPEIPLRALREIVVNSFAHAQYGTGVQHEIDIHPGKVVIYNPGEFPENFSPEDFVLKDLSSIIRNELIAKVLYLCHDIESFGSGFKRVYSLCQEFDVKCRYEKNPVSFSFIFLRTNINSGSVDSIQIKKDVSILSDTEKKLYELLKMQPNLTREELAKELDKSVKTIQRTLDHLKEKGVISRVGTKRKGYWEIK